MAFASCHILIPLFSFKFVNNNLKLLPQFWNSILPHKFDLRCGLFPLNLLSRNLCINYCHRIYHLATKQNIFSVEKKTITLFKIL